MFLRSREAVAILHVLFQGPEVFSVELADGSTVWPTHILTVTDDLHPHHCTITSPRRGQHLHVHFANLPSEDLLSHLPRCIQFIHAGWLEDGGSVLVHDITAIFEDWHFVLGVRSCQKYTAPKNGFVQQLLRFQDQGSHVGRARF